MVFVSGCKWCEVDVSLCVMLSVMLCGVWLQSTAMSSQS
ncbi:hypothetical protein DNTS_015047 [Danionella cerebrum]|uniref:Uncharacterized protein n=1 Tax=Danionella cerebrum TaxID=2873325 RepID=A0A553QPH6_9TELE|nr:hypothetical protein DNTS_015047 [Danionella translucida]